MKQFVLSDEMVNIIGESLAAQPFKVVAPVIAELQRQIDAQNAEAAGNVVGLTPPEAKEG